MELESQTTYCLFSSPIYHKKPVGRIRSRLQGFRLAGCPIEACERCPVKKRRTSAGSAYSAKTFRFVCQFDVSTEPPSDLHHAARWSDTSFQGMAKTPAYHSTGIKQPKFPDTEFWSCRGLCFFTILDLPFSISNLFVIGLEGLGVIGCVDGLFRAQVHGRAARWSRTIRCGHYYNRGIGIGWNADFAIHHICRSASLHKAIPSEKRPWSR